MIAFVFRYLILLLSSEGRATIGIMSQARRYVTEARGNPNNLGTRVNKVYNRPGRPSINYQIVGAAETQGGTASLDPLGKFSVIRSGRTIGTISSFLESYDHWAPPTIRSSWYCAAA